MDNFDNIFLVMVICAFLFFLLLILLINVYYYSYISQTSTATVPAQTSVPILGSNIVLLIFDIVAIFAMLYVLYKQFKTKTKITEMTEEKIKLDAQLDITSKNKAVSEMELKAYLSNR